VAGGKNEKTFGKTAGRHGRIGGEDAERAKNFCKRRAQQQNVEGNVSNLTLMTRKERK